MSAVLESQHQHSDDYNSFVQRINERFAALTGPIFETDATGLYAAYLASFRIDNGDRQYHTCSCCKHFIERFGGLSTVDDSGQLIPALWHTEDAPEHYAAGVQAMARIVRRAQITMPFMSSEAIYGTPISGERKDGTGEWTHYAVKPPASRIYRQTGIKNAFQAASEKREEVGSVLQALSEYSRETCELALDLLKKDTLGNSEAVLGQAQFLVDLHIARASVKGATAIRNLIARAVASSPSGFCHPRSSMIATLLDDITAGKSFEQAAAAWAKKMHPIAYQRPQAAPTAGAIAQAEKIFETMGLAPALNRRIALLEEVPKLWEPKQASAPQDGGIFGHLKVKGASPSPSMEAPAIHITLEKFVRSVVVDAEKIEVQIGGNAHFITITTAVEVDAPKIFQWDHPFAWYVWNGGAQPSQYGLQVGWVDVAGITRLPARLGDETEEKFGHQGDGLIFLTAGARETRQAGAGLFPQLLRAELREVRSVIESYSRNGKMQGLENGSAIGIDLRKGGEGYPVSVRVSSAGRSQIYKIDRWD